MKAFSILRIKLLKKYFFKIFYSFFISIIPSVIETCEVLLELLCAKTRQT